MTPVKRMRAAVAVAVAALVTGLAAPAQADDVRVPGWTVLAHDHRGAVVLACKQAYDDPTYGPLWRVRVGALAQAGRTAGATVKIYRNSRVVNSTSVSARGTGGQERWVFRTTYASRWTTDLYGGSAGTGELDGRGAGGDLGRQAVRTLATCG